MSAPLPEPWFRHLHPAEMAEFARRGRHCDVRRCREPVAVYGWYRRRTPGFPAPVICERELCTGHGETVAARHHVVLEPAPPLEEIPLDHIEPRPAARAALGGMSGLQITEHEAQAWTCDMPHCQEQARYFSALDYTTRAARSGT